MSNPNASPSPKRQDQTLFAKLVVHCLRTSCKCSPQATTNSNLRRHDSTCPYTPNQFFKLVDEYRRLKVRTFLNTIIAITPALSPTTTPSQEVTTQQGSSKKHKRVTFHARITKLGPTIEENLAPPSTNHSNKSGVNTTSGPERLLLPQYITPEIVEQLVLCNKTETHSRLQLHGECPIRIFTNSEWTSYLDNLRLCLSDPHQNPELTSWIPLLYALDRAVKIWIGQTILSLGGWTCPLNTGTPISIPSSSSNVQTQSEVQLSWPFIATREQIHLSYALSVLATNHLNSARLISHSLRKLKNEISRAASYAEKIIHLQGAFLRTTTGTGTGLGLHAGHWQTLHVESQSLQQLLLEMHLSKARYLSAQTKVIQELGRLSSSVGRFRAEVERHLDVSQPGEPEQPQLDAQPIDDKSQPQVQPPLQFQVSGPPIAIIRTALHELCGFDRYWPPNSRRKVDFVYKLLGLVYQDVVELQQDIEAMKLLWASGLVVSSEDTLLRLVIRPSEAKIGGWCDAARVSLALNLTGNGNVHVNGS